MTRRFNRRRFLTALGLGAGSLYLPSLGWRRRAKASGDVPVRVVFFITPHGTVPPAWRMRQPGMDGVDYAYDLTTRPEAEWSPILRPCFRHRQKLLVVDNLAKTTAYAEIKRVQRDGIGHDVNEHHVAQAHLLTCDYGWQREGDTVIGGTRSVDQVIGDAIAAPGRWKSRVYGYRHQHPYSFIARGEPAPRIDDPSAAFAEILGLVPSDTSSEPTREDRIRAARSSVLDLAAQEFEAVLPRLGAEDRDKLDRHRQLIRDLELSLSTAPAGGTCDPTFMATGHGMSQFARLTAISLACDLTRVVTIVSSKLAAEEFGADPSLDIHQDIAHNSTAEAGGHTPEAEQAMADYNEVYARHFATLLDELDSIPEKGETLLDHTVVVWLTELATGTHWLDQLPHVLAGGACGYFGTGRYVHYAASHLTPFSYGPPFNIGPPQSRLYVSIMHALGMTDVDSFGLPEVTDNDGNPISLRGPLPLLQG